MTTLEQLKRRYTLPYLTLEQVRNEHLPHVKTDRHLIRLIKEGEVDLHPSRLHESTRAPRVIYLPDLARWLDARVQSQVQQAA
ncbi:MAG: pyocin activator PrtN family protein [Pseudomonas sp.]|nr:pyocin activator PrtN family protein [Pseudomonas sp.]